MQTRKCCVLVSVFSVCLVAMSCRSAPEKRYELKGKVVSVHKAQRQVTMAHEQIQGFMDAMTMPFNVREDWALEAFAPGQTVEATLVVKGDRSWIEKIRISQGGTGGSSETSGELPRIGDSIPDFRC